MKRRLFLGLLPALLLAPTGICSPPSPNFSGTWKQSNERCVPKRTGDVILHIDHRDPDLTVETTLSVVPGCPGTLYSATASMARHPCPPG